MPDSISTQDQEEAISRYRHFIEEGVKHDERIGNSGACSSTEKERLLERGRELDASEESAKGEYIQLNCAQQTGLSADAFRHHAIEVMTERERMREQLREKMNVQEKSNSL